MKWPWRTETRAAPTDFTDAVLLQLLNSATAADVGEVDQVAVVEAAVGLISRCVSTADVTPRSSLVEFVTTSWLLHATRALLVNGEALATLQGDLASSWEIDGPLGAPTYRAEFRQWDGSVSARNLTAAGTLHFRYDSALKRSGLTAKALTNLEMRLGQELSARVGHLLPVPTDGQSDAVSDLRKDLASLSGGTSLVESTSSAWGSGDRPPAGDWTQKRIGADPPETLAELRDKLGIDLVAALGVPPILLSDESSGQGARRAWHRFGLTTIEPIASVITEELSRKLSISVHFDYRRLGFVDRGGEANAASTLIAAGVDPDEAKSIAGL